MRYFSPAIIVLMTFLLVACASMDRSECLAADWRAVGFEDGLSGRAQTRVGEYRTDCAEYGVTPDLDSYREGHAEGSVQFCTEENGFRKGTEGFSYQNSCPSSLEDAFIHAYRDGRELYKVQSRINDLESDWHSVERRSHKIDRRTGKISEQLLRDDLSSTERAKLLKDLKRLNEEKVSLAERRVEIQYLLDENSRLLDELKDEFEFYFHQ